MNCRFAHLFPCLFLMLTLAGCPAGFSPVGEWEFRFYWKCDAVLYTPLPATFYYGGQGEIGGEPVGEWNFNRADNSVKITAPLAMFSGVGRRDYYGQQDYYDFMHGTFVDVDPSGIVISTGCWVAYRIVN